MAFSDLCQNSNAYKAVENEADQSESYMDPGTMVQDIITKVLDDTVAEKKSSSLPSSEKSMSSISSSVFQYPKNDTGNSFMPSLSPYNYNQDLNLSYDYNDRLNGYTFNSQSQNDFNSNGFVNFSDSDANSLLLDPISEADNATPEHLNLLRLAAQHIAKSQLANSNKFDDKYYNFFEPNQRNSLPETNIFSNNFNRPNSLNLDLNVSSNYDTSPFNTQRFPNKYENGYLKGQNQDSTDLLSYLNQLNLGGDRLRDELLQNDFKISMDVNDYQTEDYNKIQEERNKLLFNSRNFQQVPNKSFNGENNFFMNDMMSPMTERNVGQSYDFVGPASTSSMNFKPNGFPQHNDFMQRRDVNQMLPRESFQVNGNVERANFDSLARDNAQQAALRQQELARQMSLIMRNRPPPNPLNVDVSFLHENNPYLGLGALLGPSPPIPTPVLPSPMLDIPILAPFYTMRNMRSAATSSSILHARLDACYEQWRQLERERKRTEARLALAYPGRAVSSSNSIPVPRLPPCPTRVDRLTVDMLREHTKVLTLMGKMETLRASVCVAQNKKPNKQEDGKITVLKRGQENVPVEKDGGAEPLAFDPTMWRDDVKNLAEIAPHSEVESAMLAWRNAVAAVQAARRREMAPHTTHARYMRADPILQLADAVKQLCVCARRARCAMWCDLTLTVALAPHSNSNLHGESSPLLSAQASPKSPQEKSVSITPTTSKGPKEQKEEPPSTENQPPKNDAKQENEQNPKSTNKQTEKDKSQRRHQNYRKVNQRHDFYPRNQRYDNRFVQNRHPFHYLATGPIN